MIQSMTGFGKHIVQLPSKKITIELKSLNSKNLDVNMRMPSAYREKELELRKIISGSLIRGKIDFGLYVEATGTKTTTQINHQIVKGYMMQLENITGNTNETTHLLEIAMRLPDTMKTGTEAIEEEEYKSIKYALEKALTEINLFRSEEGTALEKDFLERITILESLLTSIVAIDAGRQNDVRERLNKAISDLKTDYDANRFEQELIYYLEKYDITEEKVRLTNHLEYFKKTLNTEDSNGKKLGFIAQEIGREINTIGSKANYAPMQQLVVQMKDELEKIKEQMLNVL